MYKSIVTCLQSLTVDRNTETSSTASQLLHAVTRSEFIVSVCVLTSLFSLTLPLSKNLQKVDCDLAEANSNVQHIVDIVKQRRSGDDDFSEIFACAENMMHSVDCNITVPRVTKRAKNRPNMEFNNPEEYFRRSVYVPVIDDFIQQLDDRFENHWSIISSLHRILPAHCVSAHYCDIEECVQFYCQDGDIDSIEAEFNIWQTKWPKTPLSE